MQHATFSRSYLFKSLCLSAFVFAMNEEEREVNDCFKL